MAEHLLTPQPLDEAGLYAALAKQAEGSKDEPSWLSDQMHLLPMGQDVWHLGICDPEKVFFEKPPDRQEQIQALRQTVLNSVRPVLIEDQAWLALKEAFYNLYTDPRLMEHRQQRQGNLFVGATHTRYTDVVEMAAASYEVRRDELSPDNPYYEAQDPAKDHIVMLNRLLALLDHDLFNYVTEGVPLLPGMVLIFTDAMTTISASGSGLVARHILGQQIQALKERTKSQMTTKMTHGNQIIFLAIGGNQARHIKPDKYSEAWVIAQPDEGQTSVITKLNQGAEPESRKNALAMIHIEGIGMDQLAKVPPKTLVVPSPDIWLPTTHNEVDLAHRALIRSALGKSDKELRYGKRFKDTALKPKEEEVLAKAALTLF